MFISYGNETTTSFYLKPIIMRAVTLYIAMDR